MEYSGKRIPVLYERHNGREGWPHFEDSTGYSVPLNLTRDGKNYTAPGSLFSYPIFDQIPVEIVEVNEDDYLQPEQNWWKNNLAEA